MKKWLVIITAVLAAITVAVFVFAADEAQIPDPTIIGANEPEVAPPKEAMAGSAVAEEKVPQNLKAAADGMKVNLSWDKFEGAGIYYNVYRSVTTTGGFNVINKNPLEINSFTDSRETSLFPPKHNTEYFYKVTATDGKNETGDSNQAQAKPAGPLMPPSNISVVARETSVILKWAEPVSSGENTVSAYNIFRGLDSAGGPQITKTAATALEFHDEADGAGLTKGVKYFYWMQSVDSTGATSPLSVSVAAAPYSGISSPRNVTISPASSESIKILWEEPDTQGTYALLGYNIYRSTEAAGTTGTPINERIVKPYPDESGRLFYYDNIINSEKAPDPGVQYYYKVVPVDTEGNTGSSNEPVTGKIEFMKIEKSGILSADISEYGLPPDSKLKLTGIKSVDLTVDVKIWDEESLNRQRVSTNVKIEQPLRLDLSGNIGSKIFVDIKYDDSEAARNLQEDKKISIQYKGDKDETLQELSFGDINFDLPSVRYVRPLASLFGIKGKASFLDDKLKISGAWAQTKGITDIQEFTGTMREMQTNGSPGITINDTNFIANTYYYLTKDDSKITALNPGYTGTECSIEPGSVLVYLDDQYVTSDNLNTVITATEKYHLDRQDLGSAYTVDYKNGVIKFNTGISATHIIAVAYRLTNGESVGYTSSGAFDFNEAGLVAAANGITTNDAHLIKANGNDISHMVMNYYYMGATQINNPSTDTSFDIKIYDNSNADQAVPRPWETNAGMYYEIDSNFGIIKFKNYYPFSVNSSSIIYPGPATISGNDADAYNVNRASAVSRFRMVFKYRYNIASYRLDYSPVVANSERVFLDGRLLKKDTDYNILYETGDIVFVNKNLITEKSLVKIVYEYSPFIQSFDSTVLGARLDYDILENLKIGGTYIRKDSTKGTEPPDARSTEVNLSTPYGGYVWDVNTSFNLKKDDINYIISSLPLVGKTDLPVDFKFDAEVAGSDLNMNTYDWKNEKGIAIIDNMEGTDNERTMNMVSTSWFPASLPSGLMPVNRVYTARSSYADQGHQKTQDFSEGYTPSTVEILKIGYDGLTDQKWDALRQVISVAGENLHNFSYLEMWVKVKTDRPIRMNVDIGVISEDSNGNNSFKYNTLTPAQVLNDSEDTVPAGQVQPSGYMEDGEDIGIGGGTMYTWFPREYWGANDDVLNSEDMNANGSLDVTEKFYRYAAVGATGYPWHPELEFSNRDEWVNIRIPLNQVSDLLGLSSEERDVKNTQFLSMIKHIRLTFMGTGSSPSKGEIEIESIKFIGNSWMLAVPTPGKLDGAGNVIDSPDPSKFDAITVKKSTEPAYIPNLDFFEWTTEDDKNYEESLKVSYTLSSYDLYDGYKPIYYVRKPFNASLGYDYRPYKYLKVDVFYKTKDPAVLPGRTMFIRLGQDGANENLNFYQFNEQLDNLTPGVWQTVVFRVDGSDKKRSEPVGTPNLRQINIITIGFINPNTQAATEELYINNIRLTDPDAKRGMAKYMNSALNITGIGTLTHTYEDKETDFNSIEDITKSQMRRHSSINSVRFNPSFVPFLSGFTNAYSRTQDFIEDKYKDDLSYTANQSVPDTNVESYESIFALNQVLGISIGNNIQYKRQKDIYYGDKKDWSNKTDRLIWQPTASWTAPKQFFFIPLGNNRFESNYVLDSFDTDYLGAQSINFHNNWGMKLRQRYKWEGGYDLWKFNITPVYEYVLEEGKGNMSGYDYYKYAVSTDGYNYSPEYLVLKREIIPAVSIRLNDAWIFSPSIVYSTSYRLDYGSSQLYTTGRLEVYSGLSLAQLLSFLPNISRYSFSIDLNETYDNRYDPSAFKKFDSLTFERKWNAFLWKMLYDEKEMKALESISLRGAINISHSVSLDNINIADYLSFNPRATYSKYRNSSGRTLQDPTESWTFDMGSIQVKKITIPGLEFMIKDKTISAGYSYRKDQTRSALNTADITKDSDSHSGRMTLYYGIDGSGLGGNVGFSVDRSDSRERQVKNYSMLMSPTLTINYVLRKEDPITVWDWVPGIGGKVFKFEQNLNLSLGTGLTFKQSETSGTKVDTRTLSVTLSGNYNMLQNLKVNAAVGYTATKDNITSNNSNQIISVSVGGDLEF